MTEVVVECRLQSNLFKIILQLALTARHWVDKIVRMPRYTKSNDGVERCTVVLRLRFTREDMATIRRLADLDNNGDWRDWLESHAALGIEGDLTDCSGEYEQRYGRGGD
jgi:hypothetical protein